MGWSQQPVEGAEQGPELRKLVRVHSSPCAKLLMWVANHSVLLHSCGIARRGISSRQIEMVGEGDV